MAIHRVLIVDPDRTSREALLTAARALGLRAQEAPGVRQVRERLASSPPDLLLIDPGPEDAGAGELASICEQHPDLPVVVLSESRNGDASDSPARRDGFEELSKRGAPEALEHLLERLERGARLRQENEYLRLELSGGDENGLVARSAAMAEVVRNASRSARSRGAVLISGEPGTGKRRLARYVHAHSPRRARPLVRAACAELSPAELEARLFGSPPGTERTSRPALLEVAYGGTLLLEEVSELSPSVQARLVAALEQGQVAIGGSSRPLALDVRVIATTRCELLAAVAAGIFSSELHRHLSALSIHLRPLRERPEDLLPMAEAFAQRAACELGRPRTRFSAEAEQRLLAWSWPGNARELECVVRRAVFLAPSGEIGPDELGLGPSSRSTDSPPEASTDSEGELARRLANLPMADIERIAILATLESTGGNKTEAARRLGLTARTLSNKLKLWRSQGLVV